MKYLLDTMVWLWSVGPTELIGSRGLEILRDGKQDLYLSAASSWEIAIKTKLGKFDLPEPPSRYVPKRTATQGIRSLSITQSHTLNVYDLPLHHSDPFDRLIIAQALAEGMAILTSDRMFKKYEVEIIWCGK
ncbi:MAG TPA: type II toxin-antitoxin system VapC family toxin [Candidatus Acidoferrum sp.]|nr:type II toxin-antitoxin system VapC family toxin [Candidatus Acidoferrum sp.]